MDYRALRDAQPFLAENVVGDVDGEVSHAGRSLSGSNALRRHRLAHPGLGHALARGGAERPVDRGQLHASPGLEDEAALSQARMRSVRNESLEML